MYKGGRLAMIKSVISAALFGLLATDITRWALEAFDKKQQSFFWRGRDDANGGSGMVA
jgi:hypothetical protein